MNIDNLTKTIKELKGKSKKRKFKQTFDLILNLKDIDLKKQDNQVDTFTNLHYSKGKQVKICGLVGPELNEQVGKVFDHVVSNLDFPKFAKDRKLRRN